MVEKLGAARMPQGTPAPQPHILLVERQAPDRELVVRALGALKCRVEGVATGGDALAHVRRARFDLILLGASLPDVSGSALIGALRELPGLGQLPIVTICAGDSAELRQACLAAGATAHLSRPFEIDRLVRLVGQLICPPGAGPRTEPVLDLDHLRSFTEDDQQLEGELSTLFLATAEMYLDQMREALSGGRPWTSIAHALKGASGNLGARRLSALALLAERSEPDRTQLAALQHAIEELRALFTQRLGG
jgi:CheY-like chemotaxis protein